MKSFFSSKFVINRNAIVILLIIIIGFIFHYQTINEFSSHIHAWAQSDRYALAQGFVNNGLNFFKPETFVLNHQFPDNWEMPSSTSITAVDFPIHDFITAIFMKISGITSPWVFRLYTLIYSMVGLLFLFKLSYLLTQHFHKSLFVVVFASTSPVFVYYQGGFLPTIPSLANVIVGLYFYSKYLFKEKDAYLNITLVFLTVATLSRTTFAIPLIAVFGIELLKVMQGKTKIKPKLLPVLISISVIVFFFFYNYYLREKYGSIFLNHIMPATSFNNFVELIKVIKTNWFTHYFSIIHYIILIIVFAISSFLIVVNKVKLGKVVSGFLFLASIVLLGCIAFALLMLKQFPNHDYYFLDTFYLPFILLLIVGLSVIPTINFNRKKEMSFSVILLISIPMIINASMYQKSRRVTGSWDRVTKTINNFRGSEHFMDSVNISHDDKILVLDAYAPNIPFLLMNRKGYVVMTTKRDVIENALQWDYDYIVIQNEFFLSDIYSVYPEIISVFDKQWDNGKISIFKLYEHKQTKTLNEFLGIDNKLPIHKEFMGFDSVSNVFWKNINITDKYYLSGSYSGLMTKDMDYGLTYKTDNLPALTDRSRVMVFQSFFLSDTLINCELVITINENGENIFNKAFSLNNLLKQTNEWEKVDLMLQLPKVNSIDYEFALYIWNKNSDNLWFDDFGFKLY